MVILCKSKTSFTHLDNATRNINSWPTWKREFAGLNDNTEKKQNGYTIKDQSEVITYALTDKKK